MIFNTLEMNVDALYTVYEGVPQLANFNDIFLRQKS